MSHIVRHLIAVAGILLAGYAVVVVWTLLAANRLIFHPPAPSYTDRDGVVRVTASDGVELAVRVLPGPDTALGVIYSHGNAEDIGQLAPVLSRIRGLGAAVLAYDYRGYGTSGGRPDVAGTYRDIEAAYEYMQEELAIPPNRIVLWGHSVGSGPTLWLASRAEVAGVIVESAFVSAFRTVTQVPVLPFDKYPNYRRVGSLACPILVVHGRRDEVVPFWHGKALYERAREPKRALWLENSGHNDIPWTGGERYEKQVRAFLDAVRTGKRGAGTSAR